MAARAQAPEGLGLAWSGARRYAARSWALHACVLWEGLRGARGADDDAGTKAQRVLAPACSVPQLMGEQAVRSSHEVFEAILRWWWSPRFRERALTLPQVAGGALRSGTSANASRVGHVMIKYSEYFIGPDHGGHKWRVHWPAVQRDYGHLIGQSTATTKRRIPVAEMREALRDEVSAVHAELSRRPFRASIAQELGSEGDAYLYLAELRAEPETEFPVPEGIGVQLRWPGPAHVEATVLNVDRETMDVILGVGAPLARYQKHSIFDLIPKTEQLIGAVERRLEMLEQIPHALSLRLADPRFAPEAVPFSGSVITDGLDESQVHASRKALTHDITYLWGPPGTGKTYTLATIVASSALAGERVVATALSNVAVDQLAKRTVQALERAGAAGQQLLAAGGVLRLGRAALPEVQSEGRLFPDQEAIRALAAELRQLVRRLGRTPRQNGEARARLQQRMTEVDRSIIEATQAAIAHATIVLTTSVRACMEDTFLHSEFSLVVIDEASMMPIPYVMAVGMVAQKRLVIVGDFRQLNPIALSHTPRAERWLHRDPFELVGIDGRQDHPALAMLNVQRRMHHDICELINGPFYNGRLRTASDGDATRAASLPPLPGRSVVFVQFGPEEGSLVEKTSSGSRRNAFSACVAANVALQCLAEDGLAIVGIYHAVPRAAKPHPGAARRTASRDAGHRPGAAQGRHGARVPRRRGGRDRLGPGGQPTAKGSGGSTTRRQATDSSTSPSAAPWGNSSSWATATRTSTRRARRWFGCSGRS